MKSNTLSRHNYLTPIALGAMLSFATIASSQADESLAAKNNCTACHQIEIKIVGPSFKDIAAKYKGQDDAVSTLAQSIKNGSTGTWGEIPMPPNTAVSDADLQTLSAWILSL